MFSPTKLLDAMQSEWPLLSSLMIVGTTDPPPHWVATSAQRVAMRMHPGELAACRAQLPLLIRQLAAFYRRWVVTSVLAVLLALAVVSAAHTTPLDGLHTGILMSVLIAILLPPLVICNGIARDYVAAQALSAVLCSTVQQTTA
jgi:hypothetical protein